MRRVFIMVMALMLFVIAGCSGNLNNKNDEEHKSLIPQDYEAEQGTLMFDEPPERYAIYNYCPSIIEEAGERHVYYCSNLSDTNIKDYVAYRHGIKSEGVWYYSPKKIVLQPTEGTWDAMHTCDPDVIKGEFRYGDIIYNYLMTYLGCVTTDNQSNEVGLAVALQPEGPWIKCDNINPIVSFEYDSSRSEVFQWGYGQSSLVSVDKSGRVLLTYTQGTVVSSGTRIERWNFANLDTPVREFSIQMPIKGIGTHNNSGAAPALNNADFAYDPVNKRLFAVGDSFPFAEEPPSFVASVSYLGYIQDLNGEQNEAGDLFLNYNGTSWQTVKYISEAVTGFPRNHNTAIVTDEYGYLLAQDKIEVAYTISEINKPNNSLWTYRIHRKIFEII